MTAAATNPARRRALWLAGATWVAALLTYLLLAYRITAVLALEYEAMVVNLAQDWAPGYPPPWWARRDWIPLGRLALQAGAAPLWCLLVARALQRMSRRWAPASPLHVSAFAPRTRGLAALLCGLPLVAFCGPFALALALWISVEAFAWIQWYGNIEPALEWIRTRVPMAVAPATLVAGVALLRRGLTPAAGAPRRLRWLRRAAWATVLLPAVAVLLPALVVAGPRALRAASAPGRVVFEQRCGGCHDRALTLYYVKTPAEWERTVAVQVDVEGVSLGAGEREDLNAFLRGVRSYPDRWVFRTRCQRCHGLDTRAWEDRTGEEWGRIVDRHARTSPYYYRPDVRAQLVAHLDRTHGSESATVPDSVAEIDRLCSGCHPVAHGAERFADRDPAEIRALVARMGTKMAQPPDAETEARVAREWAALIADPQRMGSALPHDLPVVDGRLRW